MLVLLVIAEVIQLVFVVVAPLNTFVKTEQWGLLSSVRIYFQKLLMASGVTLRSPVWGSAWSPLILWNCMEAPLRVPFEVALEVPLGVPLSSFSQGSLSNARHEKITDFRNSLQILLHNCLSWFVNRWANIFLFSLTYYPTCHSTSCQHPDTSLLIPTS